MTVRNAFFLASKVVILTCDCRKTFLGKVICSKKFASHESIGLVEFCFKDMISLWSVDQRI